MLDNLPTYSMSDFLKDHKSYVARLKETGMPEVLTMNGRAKVVILDTESYQYLIETIRREEEIRAIMARDKMNAPHREEISEAEIERSEAVMRELVEETERLGLYR